MGRLKITFNAPDGSFRTGLFHAADTEPDGAPAHAMSAHLIARAGGTATLQRRLCAGTIANALMPAFPVTFDHQPSGDPE